MSTRGCAVGSRLSCSPIRLSRELFARAQAGVDDLDVLAGLHAPGADEALGQLADAHLFAGVEEEDLAARASAAAWMTRPATSLMVRK